MYENGLSYGVSRSIESWSIALCSARRTFQSLRHRCSFNMGVRFFCVFSLGRQRVVHQNQIKSTVNVQIVTSIRLGHIFSGDLTAVGDHKCFLVGQLL